MQAQSQVSQRKESTPTARPAQAEPTKQPQPLQLKQLQQVGGGVRSPQSNW